MATLGEVGELLAEQLRERVDRLVSAVEDDAEDLVEVARRADAVGALADKAGEIYLELDRMLARGLDGDEGSQEEGSSSRREREGGSRRERRQAEQSASGDDDVTKDELLEQAREWNIEGRSSMTKEELAQAVEEEESLTKEELLERASEAGIEGRSSMTKKELRKALNDGGA